MHIPFRRSTLKAAAAAALGAMLVSTALTVGVVSASATSIPPWEPVANPPQVSGLTFYDSSGNVITSGSIDAPFAAYVQGSGTLRPGDTVATLYAYTPVDATPPAPGGWSGGQLSGSDTYPNASAPSALASSTLPLVTDPDANQDLATYISNFPNTDTSDDGYAGLYVLRLVTGAKGKSATTSYDSADIAISGDTWSVVYTLLPTTTGLTANPTSPQNFGTTVTLTATVTSGAAGTVQFENGSTDIGTPVTVTDGTASTTTSTLPVGTDTLNAVFTPTAGNGYGGSTGTTSFTVDQTATTTTLTTNPSSPGTYGSSVTLNAAVSPAVAGTVQFENGSTAIGSPVTVTSGAASTSTSTLPLGASTLNAVFTPTATNDYIGSSGTTSFTVDGATTTTTLTASPSSPQYVGTSVTLNAAVSPAVAGTVQFENGSTDIGTPVTVISGAASTSTTTLPEGNLTLNAVFTPTSDDYATSTGTLPFTVSAPTPTTTTLTTNPSSSATYGTSVTLNAAVSPAVAGTVQFENGSTDIGTPVTVISGAASTSTTTLPEGSLTLNAVFTPTSDDYGTSTGTTPFTVNPASTTTTLTTSPSSPQYVGTSVTLNAAVSPAVAGTVQFENGSTDIGTPVTVISGAASTSTTTLPEGSLTLKAVFTPTSDDYTGSSDTTPFDVETPTATTTALTTNPSSSATYGTSVTLNAAVSPAVAGTVQFENGSTDIGAPVTVTDGAASTSTTTLPEGSLTLKAVFVPTSNAYAGSSGTTPFTVNPASTTTTLTASPSSPQYFGTSVTLNTAVSPAVAGTVQFENGSTDIGAPVTVISGAASTSTAALPVGSLTLNAVFTPTNADYATSTGTTPFTVDALTATTTTLAAAPASPQVSGTSVTLTATVSPAAAGTVQFENGSTDIGAPVTVTGGAASISTSTLPVGDLTLEAVFTPTAGSGFVASTGTASYTVTATALTPPAPPAGATSSNGASSDSPTGTATASVTGLAASGTGQGALTVATYSGNPVVGSVSNGTGVYFDVAVSSGSTFGSLTITITDLGPGGQSIDWWNGTAWVPFSDQTFDAATDSVTATVSTTTSPTLAQLTGTEVAGSTNPAPSLGYWLVGADGGVFAFNGAQFYGSTGNLTLNKPIVGIAATPDGKGYWLVASDGGVFAYGDAAFYGSTGNLTLNRPIVGIAATPDGKGYWLVASDGGVFAYGDAAFYGSTGNLTLNRPIVGIAATPDGKGYWLVASDGGVFAYGDAAFYGSTGNLTLNRPIVGIAATPDGKGYWLVASDGGVFAYGDAAFYGSTGNLTLNRPIVGIAATPDGKGYWLVASDGGVFAYGDAAFYGSTGGTPLNAPVIGLAGA